MCPPLWSGCCRVLISTGSLRRRRRMKNSRPQEMACDSRSSSHSSAPAGGRGVARRAGAERPGRSRSRPERAEYVNRLESICKPGVEATQRAVRGRALRHSGRTPRRRGGQARQGRADLRRDRAQDLAPFRARRSTRSSSPSGSATCGSRSPIWPGPPQLCAPSASSSYQHNAVRFVHTGNLANDVVIAFGFNYCRFKFSRFD